MKEIFKSKSFWLPLLIILLFGVGNINAQLADSPWPIFRGNSKHTGLSSYDTSHVDGTVKWIFEVKDDFESSPTIDPDGTIYLGSHNNNLYAVNPDGTQKWKFDAGDPVYDERYDVWKGILSSPAIASDGTIYIRSLSNKLYAINPDGTEKWSFPIKTSTDTWSSPTIGDDGTIYVGSARDSGGGKIHAINPDGTEKWKFATESDVFPSPTIGDDGTIYSGAGATGKLYAINPDGTEKWHFQTGLHIESTVAIGSGGTIYFGSWDNNVYALNPDGTEKWHFVTQGEGIVSSPAIDKDGTIYIVANDNNIYALNPDGTEKWHLLLGEATETSSSPAIGADGTIYVGFAWTSNDIPTFFAINPDGTKKWTFNTNGGISSSPAIDKDGTVYISSYSGSLYAFTGPSTDEVPVDGEGEEKIPTEEKEVTQPTEKITPSTEEGYITPPTEGMPIIYVMGLVAIVVVGSIVIMLRKRVSKSTRIREVFV